MAALNEVGLVGMHDAGETRSTLELYRDMASNDDEWTVRVYGMVECEKRNTFCPEEAAAVAGESDFLTVRSVKLFAGEPIARSAIPLFHPSPFYMYTDNTRRRTRQLGQCHARSLR